jgi:hypothetical protein
LAARKLKLISCCGSKLVSVYGDYFRHVSVWRRRYKLKLRAPTHSNTYKCVEFSLATLQLSGGSQKGIVVAAMSLFDAVGLIRVQQPTTWRRRSSSIFHDAIVDAD